jgi:HPt (histidine-containing phosphotransfer) domain-containing protein
VALMTEPVLADAAFERLRRIGGATLLRQMIELFLEYGPDRTDALVDGVMAGDAAQVERAAHTLKSTAGNLGAVRLQHAAQAVETAAAQGEVAGELTERLLAEYEESTTALRRVLEELGT